MTGKQLLYISVLLVLGQMLYGADAQQCSGKKDDTSIFGMMLRRHIFKRITGAPLGDVCLRECYRDVRCQSFNFVISQYMCELNNRTKEARPEDFVPDSDRYYFRRDKNRVPLGSVPELPAETCKEIKASEDGQALSGKYWFDSIIPGKTVLAHCDMEKEDADECSASIRVCDVHANCQNTQGSFRCFCNDGYTGDGKTCVDMDECASDNHNCLSGTATCTNIVGSFNCSCNHGYVGDGRTSCVPVECQNYQSLTNGDRKNTYSAGLLECDYNLVPDWYRFQGDAGTKMATTCVPENYCGTHAPGWLNGAHPTVAEGQVTRQVCFHYFSNCCVWAINVYVRNCGDYFVYYINRTPPEHTCHLRYCGAD